MEALLGANLIKPFEGDVPTASAFEGKKAVGIYFSAHWCPPCRGFTPKLAEMYNDGLREAGLEIVFVSSDKDQDSFNGYLAEMPWLAVPFEKRDIKEELSKKFKVQGIPTFIIVDPADGSLINKDGRSAVMEDPKGTNLPWKPPTFAEALGSSFLKGTDTAGAEAVAGKHIGLYFSAHWCPPCRAFTPELAKWYKGVKAELGDKFEIVFCSADKDEAAMKSYYAEHVAAGGDWLAQQWADKGSLEKVFEVGGYPTFIIVSPEGKVVNANGRSLVPDAKAADFPFTPPAIGNMESPDLINEMPSMCLMLEHCDAATQERILAAVTPMAEAEAAKDEPEIVFYVAKSEGSVSSQIRGMCKLPTGGQIQKAESEPEGEFAMVRTLSGETPALILMDIPDNGGYYVSKMSKEMDGSNVEKMIADWKAKTLERQQLP